VLDRLAVDPQIAGSFDWHGFGDSGVRRRRLAEDGFLGCDPPQPGDRLRQDDSCIGDVSWLAVPTGPTSTCWNIGIVIVPEFRGKGYGTAAQRLVTGYVIFPRRDPEFRVKLRRVWRLGRCARPAVVTVGGQAAMDACWASSVMAAW
jgi:hypothetical protein